ncbi:MAG: MFS transporter, partial [Clostridia bacterium]|nr:MFS transporter [Clostridia bacterium]
MPALYRIHRYQSQRRQRNFVGKSNFFFCHNLFIDTLYRKISLRKGIFIVSFFGAFAPLIMSIGGSAWIYYLGSAVAGIAYGAGCVYPSAILINKWFGTSTGLALGICSAGSGICSMLFSPIVSNLALHFSLRSAFLFQSATMALCAVVVFVIIRDNPAEIGISPYTGRIKAEKVRKESAKSELSASMLGWLAFMMLLNGGTGVAFSGHLSVLTVTCGYTQNIAAACVSLFGFALIIGKLCAGYIADHIGACKCGALLICTFIIGCL